MVNKYLFELPVYRIDKKFYTSMFNEYCNLNPLLPNEFANNRFGGPWQYNEIVSFLRFYQYGENQIRCELWDTKPARKVKTRKKEFILKNDKFCEVKIYPSSSGDDIVNLLLELIGNCEKKLHRRHIDKKMFMGVINHINWCSLLRC
ncbi:hypothetical protein JEO77_20325 [Aeromonas veronii]|uniref:hypothetical protein n=1 Tax=Aeromonas veronii TaxID=654 RepID=UPI00191F06AB|nr:hypothetical protein [Aeromonas veronii]MBL0443728.1 hypothetical protein [Aeromonas veronii]